MNSSDGAQCQHPTLDLMRIRIGEKCPDCRRFVSGTGETFETAREAVAAKIPAFQGKRFQGRLR